MKQYRKTAVVAALSVGLALVVASAFAQPDSKGLGKEQGQGSMMGMQGGMPGMMQGAMSGMMQGAMSGMQGGAAGSMGGQQLMTPQERDALAEKMRSAKTPEERQALAATTRAEMEKRAAAKGITLPQHGGNHAGMQAGGQAGSAEHKH